MKRIRCRDLGYDCNYVASGEIDEQVMLQAYDHLETTHGVEEVDPVLRAKVESAVEEA
jgi:predicted small metal-binding protein